MVGADSSVSVIDQVIQFTALFVILFPYFQYNRLIKPLVFRAQLIQLADGPAQVKLLVRQVDLSNVFFSILYNKIDKMHNLTSWAIEKNTSSPGLWATRRVIISLTALNHTCAVGASHSTAKPSFL